jgi:hypothetical protein
LCLVSLDFRRARFDGSCSRTSAEDSPSTRRQDGHVIVRDNAGVCDSQVNFALQIQG